MTRIIPSGTVTLGNPIPSEHAQRPNAPKDDRYDLGGGGTSRSAPSSSTGSWSNSIYLAHHQRVQNGGDVSQFLKTLQHARMVDSAVPSDARFRLNGGPQKPLRDYVADAIRRLPAPRDRNSTIARVNAVAHATFNAQGPRRIEAVVNRICIRLAARSIVCSTLQIRSS